MAKGSDGGGVGGGGGGGRVVECLCWRENSFRGMKKGCNPSAAVQTRWKSVKI